MDIKKTICLCIIFHFRFLKPDTPNTCDWMAMLIVYVCRGIYISSYFKLGFFFSSATPTCPYTLLLLLLNVTLSSISLSHQFRSLLNLTLSSISLSPQFHFLLNLIILNVTFPSKSLSCQSHSLVNFNILSMAFFLNLSVSWISLSPQFRFLLNLNLFSIS